MPDEYITVKVDLDGPAFKGMAPAELDIYARHVEDKLGELAVTRIRNYLPMQYMYLGHNGGNPYANPVPTDAGRLEASIVSERMSPEMVQVNDSGILYGPWIEGIHPGNFVVTPHNRNPPPRRFPGYFTFRKVAASIEADSGPLAEAWLPPYLAMMNG
jgi:hypothetical protein